MDIESREWNVNPPKEPMTSLEAMVRDFTWRFPRDRRDMVLVFCQEAEWLSIAINRACASRDSNGKMHNHQTRVPKNAKIKFADELLADQAVIQQDIDDAWSTKKDAFDALHDRLAKIGAKVPGVGPVYLYDVATRVGAYLNVAPTSLYLHAGVWQGWLALCTATMASPPSAALRRHWKTKGRIKQKRLPEEFKDMTADEVEDFLCTYRTVFHKCLAKKDEAANDN